METSVRRLPKSQVEVTLTLTADEVNRAFDKVYQELAEGPIPGFRPGKAPRIIIRRRFGEDRIRATALSRILEEHLPAAIETVEGENLQPLGEPVLPDPEEIQPTEGEPLTIPVIVSVYPEAHFDELSGMTILRPTIEITDEDVENVIQQLLDARAEWEESSEAIGPGDRVQISVQRTVDDQQDIDVSEIEVVAADPENEAADIAIRKLAGHMPGQTIEFDYDVPEDADDPAAGKTAHYKITVHKAWKKKLPELTDELAQETLGVETVDELRAKIRDDLQQERERRAFEEMRAQAIAHLLARCDIELPDVLVQGALQSRLEELEQDLGEAGTSLAELFAGGQLDQEQFMEGQRARVELLLETKVAIDSLAEREGLEPEEQDIDAEIEALARRSNNTVDFIRQAYEVQPEIAERIDNAAKQRRVVRWLLDQAEIVDVPADEFEKRVNELLDQLREARRQRREKAAQADQADQSAEEEAEEKQELELEQSEAEAAAEQSETEQRAAEQPAAADGSEDNTQPTEPTAQPADQTDEASSPGEGQQET